MAVSILQKRIVFCKNYAIVWARAWQQKKTNHSSPTERERRNRPVVSGCLPWNEKLSTASISKGGNSLLFLSTGGGNVWLTQHILLSCFGLPWNVWNSCGIPCRTKKAGLLPSSHSRMKTNKTRPFKRLQRDLFGLSLFYFDAAFFACEYSMPKKISIRPYGNDYGKNFFYDTASYARVYQAWTGFLTPRTLLQLLYPTDNLRLAYRMPRRGISSSQSWKTRLKIGRETCRPSIKTSRKNARFWKNSAY